MTMLAQRRLVKVGSNQFAYPEEKKLPNRMPDTAGAALTAAARRKAMIDGRDSDAVDAALKGLNPKTGTMQIAGALKEGATFAEVTSALGANKHSRVNPVCLSRLTVGYEKLRDAMEAYMSQNDGKAPLILMAQMGPVPQHKVRSDFSQEFLKPAGFTIDANQSFDSPEAAAEAVLSSGAVATVICSTDDTYPDLVPAFAKAVKAGAPDTVVLMAGLIPDQTDAFRAAGVDMFIHLKANNLQTLKDLQAQTGVAS
jgi:methylmalonyl-CoA mutase